MEFSSDYLIPPPIMQRTDLTGTAKLVYGVLFTAWVNSKDPSDIIPPISYADIGKVIGVDPRVVQRLIQLLLSLNLMTVYVESKGRMGTTYKLNFKDWL